MSDPVSIGPLTQRVLDYARTIQEAVAAAAGGTADWGPLAERVAVDDFERVGTFLEVQDWAQYTAMLSGWASSVDEFATTVRRISEVGHLVFYEIEERHRRGDHVTVVNSMTVFELADVGKIRRLTVYLQAPRS